MVPPLQCPDPVGIVPFERQVAGWIWRYARIMIRLTLHFSGRVQGVGFRYTTVGLSKRFVVTGYVKNMPDGRVRAVVEGEPSEVAAFDDAIHAEMPRNIRETTRAEAPASGEFTGFDVRF